MTDKNSKVPSHRAKRAGANHTKTAIFVFAILAIQLGFILSYVGAFHSPAADGIRVEVIAPSSVRSKVVDRLNTIQGAPVKATTASSDDTALADLRRNDTSAIFTVSASGRQDTLTVASAGGQSIASALETVFQHVDASESRTLTVQDAVPAQAGDGRALSAFYLVTGWSVGGYLLAAALGILTGTTFIGTRHALVRVGIVVPYAILSGIGGTLVVDQVLGALTGHFWAIAAVGALMVTVAAMVTIALQSILGIIGVGITIIFFVVLGNPSAGGAYQPELLPAFWRTISQALPNGAATTLLRNIVYFDATHIAGPLLVLASYAAAGIAATFAVSHLKGRSAAAHALTRLIVEANLVKDCLPQRNLNKANKMSSPAGAEQNTETNRSLLDH
jgi:hypothetical protein